MIKYRPDIDGLRTLAVMPVILYHAGATWLPGGFVGVDIFFVISGFLISSIILREIDAGTFSFSGFYERRLRRIIPALLVVLVASVSLFQVIALPEHAVTTSESALAALLSVSNVYFWQTSGYFSTESEFLPLLHTWSLGVEEQFYFIFPIAIMLLIKLRLNLKFVVFLIFSASFLAGYWLSLEKPSVAYYLLPARIWELTLGVVLAVGLVPRMKNALICNVAALTGLGLIVLSLFFINNNMVFPGVVALLPCVGAALIIYSGSQTWLSQNVLGSQPMVFVGTLSYSLYLWHWPVFTALRMRTAQLELDPLVALFGIALTFGLAWLSWAYVEKPFKNRTKIPTRRMVTLLASGSAVLVFVSSVSVVMNGFPSRMPPEANIALTAASDIDPYRPVCRGVENREECKFGQATSPVSYAVIGDSHASAIRPAIEALSINSDASGTLYFWTHCPFLEGAHSLTGSQRNDCQSFRDAVWSSIEGNPSLETVYLVGRWPYQITGTLPEKPGPNMAFLSDEFTITPSRSENEAVFERALVRTLDRLEEVGVNVVVLGSIPEPGFNVPNIIALSQYWDVQAPKEISRQDTEARAGIADLIISRLASDRPSVTFVPLLDRFCAGERCRIAHEDVPIYYDDDHLSVSGALNIAGPAIDAQLSLRR